MPCKDRCKTGCHDDDRPSVVLERNPFKLDMFIDTRLESETLELKLCFILKIKYLLSTFTQNKDFNLKQNGLEIKLFLIIYSY